MHHKVPCLAQLGLQLSDVADCNAPDVSTVLGSGPQKPLVHNELQSNFVIYNYHTIKLMLINRKTLTLALTLTLTLTNGLRRYIIEHVKCTTMCEWP